MKEEDREKVIEIWRQEFKWLSERRYHYVQIFEKQGFDDGKQQPSPSVARYGRRKVLPLEPMKELAQLRSYQQKKGKESPRRLS